MTISAGRAGLFNFYPSTTMWYQAFIDYGIFCDCPDSSLLTLQFLVFRNLRLAAEDRNHVIPLKEESMKYKDWVLLESLEEHTPG